MVSIFLEPQNSLTTKFLLVLSNMLNKKLKLIWVSCNSSVVSYRYGSYFVLPTGFESDNSNIFCNFFDHFHFQVSLEFTSKDTLQWTHNYTLLYYEGDYNSLHFWSQHCHIFYYFSNCTLLVAHSTSLVSCYSPTLCRIWCVFLV